jgi:hypothetical protein
MSVFVVERYLAGWTAEAMFELVRRVERAGESLREDGVHHVQSVVMPGDETCLCVFHGPDADIVRRANEFAGLPVDRVVPGELMQARARRDGHCSSL